MKKLWTINDIQEDITYISVFTLIICFVILLLIHIYRMKSLKIKKEKLKKNN